MSASSRPRDRNNEARARPKSFRASIIPHQCNAIPVRARARIAFSVGTGLPAHQLFIRLVAPAIAVPEEIRQHAGENLVGHLFADESSVEGSDEVRLGAFAKPLLHRFFKRVPPPPFSPPSA